LARLPYQGNYDDREDIGKMTYDLYRAYFVKVASWEGLSEQEKEEWRTFGKSFSNKVLASLPKEKK